jgi:hypothetical protein
MLHVRVNLDAPYVKVYELWTKKLYDHEIYIVVKFLLLYLSFDIISRAIKTFDPLYKSHLWT